MSTPFTIVDLFAGPGGLDLAARRLGIPAEGIEWDDGACATRAANRLATRKGDVRRFGPEQFEHADVLVGGPPCQTFTVAGTGSGRKALDQVLEFADRFVAREPLESIRADLATLDDERTGLVLEPLRWALQAVDAGRPFEVIVLEQVPAVRPVWDKYAELLDKEGYSVAEPKVLRTEEYGVPQTRRRAIFIARRRDSKRLAGIPGMPKPTHDMFDPLRKARIPRLHGPTAAVSMAAALPDRPTPFVVISNYGTGGDPKIRGRRYSHEPSATVTGKVSRNRVESPEGVATDRFTWSEMGQLQTFPAAPDWTWAGKDISQQIGNAVPPRLGMHILAAALDIPRDDLDAAIRKYYAY
ncbi:DNA cytosine methyltransferase [Yinghuangia sp. ASG 101]|uniref:DNA cytosine methyltransferase n=1 Tax=Yinghuangia sp. ASG 101 TaxID=2896848 RepID=UPI001E33A5AF|nr:DNA cytosine methyltransferase [Yinghuangia sp. ASG 101]UGQ13488.1 DNA cytosine methyltransferase [Yinghuangia sp. ASG 101]